MGRLYSFQFWGGHGTTLRLFIQIPELAYCVSEGLSPSDKTIYYLNYQDLFVHAVAALKELDAKVSVLESRLNAM